MKSHVPSLLLVISAILVLGCSRKPAVRQYPLEDFIRNPEVSTFALSPDGRYYSYLAPYEKRMNIHVVETGSDTPPVRVTAETARGITRYAWVGNNRLVYLMDTGGDENFRLYGVDADGGNFMAYTDMAGVRTYILDPMPGVDTLMRISTNERDATIFDPYLLNTRTGERTMVWRNPGNARSFVFDNDGVLRIVTGVVDGINTEVLHRPDAESEFRRVLTAYGRDDISFYNFTPDNKYVYARSNLDRDKLALVLFDPVTGEEVEELFVHDTYDINQVHYSDKRGRMLWAMYNGFQYRERGFLDSDEKQLYDRISALFPGYSIMLQGTDRDEDKYIFLVESDRNRGMFYLYDAGSGTLDKLAEACPWLPEEDMARVFPVRLTARDGLPLEGYVTLPAGLTPETARNLPAVINVHGGPTDRDRWMFHYENQFLANRGYAVMQVNFRGSGQLGRKFKEASDKQWGQAMQDDVTDATLWLIGQGIADPDRVAIYGISYGGYSALMGLVREPGLYAAGLDYVGVSNLFSFLNTIPPYWKPMLESYYSQIGHPVKDSVMLRENSPALNADRIKAPLFIAQGANDPRVNKAESDQMVEALRALGVEVEYMVKDNEGHMFRNEENNIELYSAVERFLDRHVKNR